MTHESLMDQVGSKILPISVVLARWEAKWKPKPPIGLGTHGYKLRKLFRRRA